MLFSDDTDANGDFGEALRVAEADPDSRGTVGCEQKVFKWACAGTTVVVVQQTDRCDTAAVVWDEAISTAMYLDRNRQRSLGCTCDLGAGTGILGLWVSLAGLAATVVLADRPSWLPYLECNISLNAERIAMAAGTIATRAITWGDTCVPRPALQFDTIIASSLLYDVAQHNALLKTLQGLRPKRLILSFATRDEIAEAEFIRQLGATFECERAVLPAADTRPGRGAMQIWDCTLLPVATASLQDGSD